MRLILDFYVLKLVYTIEPTTIELWVKVNWNGYYCKAKSNVGWNGYTKQYQNLFLSWYYLGEGVKFYGIINEIIVWNFVKAFRVMKNCHVFYWLREINYPIRKMLMALILCLIDFSKFEVSTLISEVGYSFVSWMTNWLVEK